MIFFFLSFFSFFFFGCLLQSSLLISQERNKSQSTNPAWKITASRQTQGWRPDWSCRDHQYPRLDVCVHPDRVQGEGAPSSDSPHVSPFPSSLCSGIFHPELWSSPKSAFTSSSHYCRSCNSRRQLPSASSAPFPGLWEAAAWSFHSFSWWFLGCSSFSIRISPTVKPNSFGNLRESWDNEICFSKMSPDWH